MKKKVYLIVSACLFLFALFSLLGLLVFKDYFRVTRIEIEKDFEADNRQLLNSLGLKTGYYIWQYDTGEINRVLQNHVFFDQYRVEKIYPGRIKISLSARVPVARIAGKNGILYFLDKRGLIYAGSNYRGYLPLVTAAWQDEIKNGSRLPAGYRDLATAFSSMRETDTAIYESISQVDLIEANSRGIKYAVNYRTLNHRIYLKNKINVEIIKKGLSASLLVNELAPGTTSIVKTKGDSFYY